MRMEIGARQGHFRRKPRPGRRVEIRYAVVDGAELGPEQTAFTENIGVGGAFIVSDDPLPAGTTLVFGVTVPGSGREVEMLGEVRWIADGDDEPVPGMGVRFHGLDEDELLVLNDYFATITPSLDHDEF